MFKQLSSLLTIYLRGIIKGNFQIQTAATAIGKQTGISILYTHKPSDYIHIAI